MRARRRFVSTACLPALAALLALAAPTGRALAQDQAPLPMDGESAGDADVTATGLKSSAGSSIIMGKWRIHRIPELRLGQPTMDPNTGAIYHPVAISGTSISFYVIGAGEQELWEVPIIWAGDQPTGSRFHKLDYFGILEESGGLYIYSRETE